MLLTPSLPTQPSRMLKPLCCKTTLTSYARCDTGQLSDRVWLPQEDHAECKGEEAAGAAEDGVAGHTGQA